MLFEMTWLLDTDFLNPAVAAAAAAVRAQLVCSMQGDSGGVALVGFVIKSSVGTI